MDKQLKIYVFEFELRWPKWKWEKVKKKTWNNKNNERNIHEEPKILKKVIHTTHTRIARINTTHERKKQRNFGRINKQWESRESEYLKNSNENIEWRK